jgi:hypothetical protein
VRLNDYGVRFVCQHLAIGHSLGSPGKQWQEKLMFNRTLRTLLSNFLISALIEFMVCLVISFAINNENEIGYAFLILAGFWAVQLAITLKNFIVKTIFHYAINRRRLINAFEEQLHSLQLFVYRDMPSDSDQYLEMLAKDESVTRDQLIYAAATTGQFELLKQVSLSSSIFFRSAFEAALDLYRRQVLRNRQRNRD